jgi:hypothetical protein
MNRMTTVEINQSAPRPQFARQQRDATGWKPRPHQEVRALDTLKPVGTIDIEAWCLPCQEPHREDECPQRDEYYPDNMNFMICNLNDEQVTQEQINEARRIGEREGRLRALSKLTDDQKKESRREILTYKRKNALAPPSQADTPLPLAIKVATPPPPSVCELLLKPTSTDDIQLNIDVENMFGKLNMTFPMTEMCKIPSVKREILKILQVPAEEHPPIMLNTMYLDRPRDKNPPFYLSLGMNDLHLNKYMLDSGVSTNEIAWFEDNLTLWQCTWY